MHPLVQVQEAQDLPGRAERDPLGQPDEPDGPPGPALGAERDHLAERAVLSGLGRFVNGGPALPLSERDETGH